MGARADVDRLVGADNRAMMEDNHANHARFVETMLAQPDAVVLVDTVLWVFRAYRAHGFHLTYWSAQLNAWMDAMRGQLAAEHVAAIAPLYDWFIVRQPTFVAISEAQVAEAP